MTLYIVSVNKQDINDWTHFSLWRLWFTCKAPANLCTPSAVISFLLRLQNVREQKRERYMYVVQENFMKNNNSKVLRWFIIMGKAWVSMSSLIYKLRPGNNTTVTWMAAIEATHKVCTRAQTATRWIWNDPCTRAQEERTMIPDEFSLVTWGWVWD